MAREITESVTFTDVAGYEELEIEETKISARRLATYSREALKIGLRVDKIFVRHTEFDTALTAFDRIFQIAKEVSMPQGATLIGDTGTGKTTLCRYFRESLPKSSLFAPGFGCVRVRIGPRATAGQIVAALLREYKYPFTRFSENTVYLRKDIVIDLVRQKGTRMIFFDNAHHLLGQVRRRGGAICEPPATTFISDLMDETQAGVVLGGRSELERLGLVAPDLADRITVRLELNHFMADANWEGLVKGYVRNCTWFNIEHVLTKGAYFGERDR